MNIRKLLLLFTLVTAAAAFADGPVRRTVVVRDGKVITDTGDVLELNGDLFGGNPDWAKLLAVPPATLSAEEQAFLAGPVEELCACRQRSGGFGRSRRGQAARQMEVAAARLIK